MPNRRLALFLSVQVVGLGCARESTTEQPAAPDGTSEVCDHVVEVVRATPQGSDEAVLGRVSSDCKVSLGSAELAPTLVSCMLSASTVDAIESCENTERAADSVFRSLAPSNEDACDHIVQLMNQELAKDAIALSVDEVDQFLAKCPGDFDLERLKLGGPAFREQMTCAMAASTMPELMSCVPTEPEPPPSPADDVPPDDASGEPPESFMGNATYSPNPDPKLLQDTKAARFDKAAGVAIIGFCVETDGTVSGIHSVQNFPDDPKVDQILRDTVATWRFKPFIIDNKPVKTCSQKTFKLTFK